MTKLKPILKGLLMKALRQAPGQQRFITVRGIYQRAGLPPEQAKHATRKFQVVQK